MAEEVKQETIETTENPSVSKEEYDKILNAQNEMQKTIEQYKEQEKKRKEQEKLAQENSLKEQEKFKELADAKSNELKEAMEKLGTLEDQLNSYKEQEEQRRLSVLNEWVKIADLKEDEKAVYEGMTELQLRSLIDKFKPVGKATSQASNDGYIEQEQIETDPYQAYNDKLDGGKSAFLRSMAQNYNRKYRESN